MKAVIGMGCLEGLNALVRPPIEQIVRGSFMLGTKLLPTISKPA
jgi:hypothetical protein